MANAAIAAIAAIAMKDGGVVERIYGNRAGWTAVCVDCGNEYSVGYRWQGNSAFNHKTCSENAAGIRIEALMR